VKNNQKKNITKFKLPMHLNMGLIVFLFILVYGGYFAVQYVVTDHISAYEVSLGSIVQNHTYLGIALRDETVYTSDASGVLNYFLQEESNCSYHTLIYSVDTQGDFAELLRDSGEAADLLKSSDYDQLNQTISDFMEDYSDINFSKVHTFKDSLNEEVAETMNLNALSEVYDFSSESVTNSSIHLNYADAPGTVLYYTDGMEDLRTEDITEEMFYKDYYDRQNIRNGSTIFAGDPVYKLVNSQTWRVVIMVDEKTKQTLDEEGVIKVKFLKDSEDAWANVSTFTKDGQCFAELTFQNSMIRYASERYLEVELDLGNVEGLKIPRSALTSKDFFAIPEDYITKGGDSNSRGVLLQKTDGSSTSTEFVTVDIYRHEGEEYYIDSSVLSEGDVLLMPDSNASYTLSRSVTLPGVYNINKGYAVFRQIEVLYESSDYLIVSEGLSYGPALYDYIALDASLLNEGDILE
jgi:hypothetical protein